MIQMRKTVFRRCWKDRHSHCAVSSKEEYFELIKFIYNVRPLIASRFKVKERLVMYLKLAKKLNRAEIRDRTGISERQIRKILRDMRDYFKYSP